MGASTPARRTRLTAYAGLMGGPVAARRMRLTAYAGLTSSILAVALVLLAPAPWVGLIGALLLACVPAGAGIMCWVDAGEAAAQAGLTLALSLAALALTSALMLWLAIWSPRALLGLAGLAAVSCALRLSAARRGGGGR